MSLWSDFKDGLWSVADRRWLPRARVGYGARVGRDCTLGQGVIVGSHARIYNSQLGNDVSVGERSGLTACRLEGNNAVGADCELGSMELGRYSYFSRTAKAGRIRIGRFCSIGPEFMCGWGDHPTDRVSGSPVFYSTQKQCGVSFAEHDLVQERKPIRVGHDVWIGARVFVRDGVTIGNGAIIGAGAVVAKDIPAYAVVGGVPARLLRMRFTADVVEELERLAWWNWDALRLKQAQPYITQTDPRAFLAWAKNHS